MSSGFVKDQHVNYNVNDKMMKNFLFLFQKRIDSLTNVSTGKSA